LLKAIVNLQTVGDVYLDANELLKGYIWVNGRNLGRYWKKGPQLSLFCPGVWLKKG
jgi:beta-galactosidase